VIVLIHVVGGKHQGEDVAVEVRDALPTVIQLQDHYYARIGTTKCYVPCDPDGRPRAEAKVQPRHAIVSSVQPAHVETRDVRDL
jgi:hypothetical protein